MISNIYEQCTLTVLIIEYLFFYIAAPKFYFLQSSFYILPVAECTTLSLKEKAAMMIQ